MNDIAIYQHPFVDVFEITKLFQWKETTKEGQVTHDYNKQVAKNVVSIAGTTSASNYIQVPSTKLLPKKSLGLIGKYIYIVLNCEQGKNFVMHFDYVINNNRVVKLSISNMYKEFKNMDGRSLQIPLLQVPPQKWTVVCIDASRILTENKVFDAGQSPKFSMRSFQICSALHVKNVYTSDIRYAANTLPKGMALKVTGKDKNWFSEYAWVSLPEGELEQEPVKENLQSNGQKQEKMPLKSGMKSTLKKGTSGKPSFSNSDGKGVQFKSPGKDLPEEKKNSEIQNEEQNKMSLKEEMELQKKKAARVAEENLQNAKDEAVDTLERTNNQIEQIRSEYDCNLKSKNINSDVEVTLYHENTLYDANKSHKSNSEDFVLKPNPILGLDKVVGMHPRYRADQIFFNKDMKLAHELVYCQANLLLGYHAAIQKQRKFMDPALNLTNLDRLLVIEGYALTFSKQPSNSKSNDRSMTKEDVQVTIWDLDEPDRAVISFRPPIQEIKNASVSPDKKNLALSAKDFQGRELILVYAFQELVQHGKVELVGRQLSDFDLNSLRFNDALSSSLIGCGKENIRFFKIKNNFLPSQLVALNNTSRGKIFNNSVVTSRIVEQSGNRAGGKKPVNVYVSTECGNIYIINFYSRQVEKIVNVSDGGIVSLLHFAGGAEANGGFFLTCSRDQGVLRLWNHDFSKLASEVALNQVVASCDINVDGNEIAVLSQNGNISLLELDSSAFSVLMRSHADEVLGIALNDITGTLLSIGKDSSIKVWHAETMEQIHEFNTSEHDPPSIVAASHVDDLAAVGFKSGFVRIFSMQDKKMVHETMIFQSQAMDIQFDNSSKFMAVFFKNGKIVVFNLEREFQPVKNIDYEFPNAHYFSLSFSTDGALLANISSNANTVTVWETHNFSLKWYIDLTGEVISKIQFAPNGKDLLIMTTSAKLKYIRIDPLLGPSETLETVRDQYGLADKECSDFLVTPNNKYVIVAGKDGQIRVYDYFMRGKILPQQQAFHGHSVYPSCLALQSDMRSLFSVGPNNGIFKWGFYGDKTNPEDPPLNEFYEKTQREQDQIAKAAEVSEVTLPTWNQQELKTYTEEQLALARQQLVDTKDSNTETQNSKSIPIIKTNRPHTDLLQDGGLSLQRRPKVESTPPGYSYEQYEISLSKMLACSTKPKAGSNFVWNENEHYFAYSVQNILVFEDLDQERTQLLKRETNDIIHEISLSPNGKLLLAYTKKGPLDGYPQILVFDAKTRKKVNQISIEDVEIMSVEFSKNSNMLLVISYNGAQVGTSQERSTLQLYDFLDGRRDIFCKSIVPFRINAARWNFHAEYDGDEFVTLSGPDYYYWRITETLQMQYQPGKKPQQEGFTKELPGLTCLSFVEPMVEQNSVYLLIGLTDGNVWIVDTRTNTFVYKAKILDGPIHKLYSTVARICAEGVEDTKVYCWELIKKLGDFQYDASDPNYFFSGGEKTLTLDGFPSASYYDKSASQGIFLSTNGSFWLLNFIEMGTVKLKSAHTPQYPLTKAVGFKYVTPNQFHPSPQDSLNRDQNEDLYAFDQNYVIASSGADGAVKTWNMFDQEHICNFTIPKEQCVAIAAHQFKPVLISSFTDGYLRFFDMQASRNMGRCLIRSAEEDGDASDYATHLKILPSGVHIMGVTKNGQVFLIFVQSWDPLGITLHNLVSLNTAINSFEVSFLEPYNKWIVGTCNGKAIVYNRQDANAFKQELFDERAPPKFSYMDSFNVQEYVDNGFTETRKVNQLDHYYSMAKRNLVYNEVSVENEVELAFLNNDLGSHISFVRKSQNLFIRNFELHQVVKRIEFPSLLKQLEMAPGSTPFAFVTTEDNKLNMVDFVNDANRTIVPLIHDEVCTMKVCPNGRYVLTGGDKGDIVMWKIRRTNDKNGNIVLA